MHSRRRPLHRAFTRCVRGLALSMLGFGCGSPPPPPRSTPKPAARAPAPPSRLSAPLRLGGAGFDTPECAIYDARADRYLVSNVEGGPGVADGRGFISRVTPEGRVESLRFIDGGRADTRLDAPKGMAIVGELLYVADLSVVRVFDREGGGARGELAVPGAAFLNDLCQGPDGALYASDSGLGEGYVGNAGDAVYRITLDGAVTPLVQSTRLGQPNGIACTERGLYVASFARGELHTLSWDGALRATATLPKGALDGIALFDGRLYVTSWEARGVFVGPADLEGGSADVELLVGDLDAPADVGVDTRRRTLLIPLFHENALVLYPL
jgi:hypothetical protein